MKLWVNDDEFGEDFQVEVPVSNLVAALQEEGLGEVVFARRVRVGGGYDFLLPAPGSGSYLVVRIEGETP